jgi:UDP-N-acetyl-D-galactosamine dehydrogenase
MKKKIAIIGLGYVGLPLAIEFSKKYQVVAYDKNYNRITELLNGYDRTKEINKINTKLIKFTHNPKDIESCNVYIVTVPTPVDKKNIPDLSMIENATRMVGNYVKKNDLVIYESTVHPGATEEVCVPILQKKSKINCHKDGHKKENYFLCGYSPERINPGDKKRTLKKIKKLVSGSSKKSLLMVKKLYKSIGIDTYSTKGIKIAEAAKIIENTQRDLNIALINELAIIFDKMNLNTYDILRAAGTKWNFLNFKPGLVGGHCIGVDPYYLTHAIKKIGYKPKLILAGRKINDNMSKYVFLKLRSKLKEKKIYKKQVKVLLMGITFKENCPDIRNSKSYDLYRHLIDNKYLVDVFDPNASKIDVKNYYNINLQNKPNYNNYDAILITVPNKKFKQMGIKKISKYAKKKRVIFDLKNLFGNHHLIDCTL